MYLVPAQTTVTITHLVIKWCYMLRAECRVNPVLLYGHNIDLGDV